MNETDVDIIPTPLKPISVLFIDDSEADLLLIEHALECVKNGYYEVNSFCCVKKALEYLVSHQDLIDVCIIDYGLGADTAFDFINMMEKSEVKSLPIVVMTGHTDGEIDKKLMAAGIHDYWNKTDLNSETLERCIRYAIHRHQNYQIKNNESINKTNYLAHICHEIKNPLSAIGGFTKVAQRMLNEGKWEQQHERVEDCFNSITKNVELIKQLSEQLINVAQIESGHLVLNRECFSLNALLEEAYKNFTSIASQDDLFFNLKIDSEIVLFADRMRLTQIINNIVSNGIKYTEKGGITLRAKTEIIDAEEYVLIEVEDTGIGIKPEDFDLVFIEYGKAHKKVNKFVDSTGLGMPITKRLVELHGGTIDLSSEIGKGTVFSVRLPLNA